jgi:hypothetical protein
MADEELKSYVFMRADCFYVVEVPPSQLDDNIRLNPGTLRVLSDDGRTVLWDIGWQQ